MPFVAYTHSGDRVVATKQDAESWEALRVANRSQPFHLIECGSRVNLVKTDTTRFFRHAKGVGCDVDRFHGGESAEHLAAKEDLIRGVESVPGWSAEPEYPAADRSWIADVMAFGPNGEKLALEVQRSSQDRDRYRERQVRYWNDGIECFWFSSHSRKTDAWWNTDDGYPIIAADIRPKEEPVLRQPGYADDLLAEHGSRSLATAANDLLTLGYIDFTSSAQDAIARALDMEDVEPSLERIVDRPHLDWLELARERIAEERRMAAFAAEWDARKEAEKRARQQARDEKERRDEIARVAARAQAAAERRRELAEATAERRRALAEQEQALAEQQLAHAVRQMELRAVQSAERAALELERARDMAEAERNMAVQRQQARVQREAEAAINAARVRAVNSDWADELRERSSTAGALVGAPKAGSTEAHMDVTISVLKEAHQCSSCRYDSYFTTRSLAAAAVCSTCQHRFLESDLVDVETGLPTARKGELDHRHGKKCEGGERSLMSPRPERRTEHVSVFVPEHECAGDAAV
jgi:hypothetical protein